jgi:hypothetical protein
MLSYAAEEQLRHPIPMARYEKATPLPTMVDGLVE